MLHPDDSVYFEAIRKTAFLAASRCGLWLIACEPKKRPSTGTRGLCEYWTGTIYILVRDKMPAWCDNGRWSVSRIRHNEVLRTVAHELAHLWACYEHVYGNHGAPFKALEAQILPYVLQAWEDVQSSDER